MVATIIESSKDTFMLDGAVMYEVQPWPPGGFSRGGRELVLHRVWEREHFCSLGEGKCPFCTSPADDHGYNYKTQANLEMRECL